MLTQHLQVTTAPHDHGQFVFSTGVQHSVTPFLISADESATGISIPLPPADETAPMVVSTAPSVATGNVFCFGKRVLPPDPLRASAEARLYHEQREPALDDVGSNWDGWETAGNDAVMRKNIAGGAAAEVSSNASPPGPPQYDKEEEGAAVTAVRRGSPHSRFSPPPPTLSRVLYHHVGSPSLSRSLQGVTEYVFEQFTSNGVRICEGRLRLLSDEVLLQMRAVPPLPLDISVGVTPAAFSNTSGNVGGPACRGTPRLHPNGPSSYSSTMKHLSAGGARPGAGVFHQFLFSAHATLLPATTASVPCSQAGAVAQPPASAHTFGTDATGMIMSAAPASLPWVIARTRRASQRVETFTFWRGNQCVAVHLKPLRCSTAMSIAGGEGGPRQGPEAIGQHNAMLEDCGESSEAQNRRLDSEIDWIWGGRARTAPPPSTSTATSSSASQGRPFSGLSAWCRSIRRPRLEQQHQRGGEGAESHTNNREDGEDDEEKEEEDARRDEAFDLALEQLPTAARESLWCVTWVTKQQQQHPNDGTLLRGADTPDGSPCLHIGALYVSHPSQLTLVELSTQSTVTGATTTCTRTGCEEQDHHEHNKNDNVDDHHRKTSSSSSSSEMSRRSGGGGAYHTTHWTLELRPPPPPSLSSTVVPSVLFLGMSRPSPQSEGGRGEYEDMMEDEMEEEHDGYRTPLRREGESEDRHRRHYYYEGSRQGSASPPPRYRTPASGFAVSASSSSAVLPSATLAAPATTTTSTTTPIIPPLPALPMSATRHHGQVSRDGTPSLPSLPLRGGSSCYRPALRPRGAAAEGLLSLATVMLRDHSVAMVYLQPSCSSSSPTRMNHAVTSSSSSQLRLSAPILLPEPPRDPSRNMAAIEPVQLFWSSAALLWVRYANHRVHAYYVGLDETQDDTSGVSPPQFQRPRLATLLHAIDLVPAPTLSEEVTVVMNVKPAVAVASLRHRSGPGQACGPSPENPAETSDEQQTNQMNDNDDVSGEIRAGHTTSTSRTLGGIVYACHYHHTGAVVCGEASITTTSSSSSSSSPALSSTKVTSGEFCWTPHHVRWTACAYFPDILVDVYGSATQTTIHDPLHRRCSSNQIHLLRKPRDGRGLTTMVVLAPPVSADEDVPRETERHWHELRSTCERLYTTALMPLQERMGHLRDVAAVRRHLRQFQTGANALHRAAATATATAAAATTTTVTANEASHHFSETDGFHFSLAAPSSSSSSLPAAPSAHSPSATETPSFTPPQHWTTTNGTSVRFSHLSSYPVLLQQLGIAKMGEVLLLQWVLLLEQRLLRPLPQPQDRRRGPGDKRDDGDDEQEQDITAVSSNGLLAASNAPSPWAHSHGGESSLRSLPPPRSALLSLLATRPLLSLVPAQASAELGHQKSVLEVLLEEVMSLAIRRLKAFHVLVADVQTRGENHHPLARVAETMEAGLLHKPANQVTLFDILAASPALLIPYTPTTSSGSGVSGSDFSSFSVVPLDGSGENQGKTPMVPLEVAMLVLYTVLAGCTTLQEQRASRPDERSTVTISTNNGHHHLHSSSSAPHRQGVNGDGIDDDYRVGLALLVQRWVEEQVGRTRTETSPVHPEDSDGPASLQPPAPLQEQQAPPASPSSSSSSSSSSFPSTAWMHSPHHVEREGDGVDLPPRLLVTWLQSAFKLPLQTAHAAFLAFAADRQFSPAWLLSLPMPPDTQSRIFSWLRLSPHTLPLSRALQTALVERLLQSQWLGTEAGVLLREQRMSLLLLSGGQHPRTAGRMPTFAPEREAAMNFFSRITARVLQLTPLPPPPSPPSSPSPTSGHHSNTTVFGEDRGRYEAFRELIELACLALPTFSRFGADARGPYDAVADADADVVGDAVAGMSTAVVRQQDCALRIYAQYLCGASTAPSNGGVISAAPTALFAWPNFTGLLPHHRRVCAGASSLSISTTSTGEVVAVACRRMAGSPPDDVQRLERVLRHAGVWVPARCQGWGPVSTDCPPSPQTSASATAAPGLWLLQLYWSTRDYNKALEVCRQLLSYYGYPVSGCARRLMAREEGRRGHEEEEEDDDEEEEEEEEGRRRRRLGRGGGNQNSGSAPTNLSLRHRLRTVHAALISLMPQDELQPSPQRAAPVDLVSAAFTTTPPQQQQQQQHGGEESAPACGGSRTCHRPFPLPPLEHRNLYAYATNPLERPPWSRHSHQHTHTYTYMHADESMNRAWGTAETMATMTGADHNRSLPAHGAQEGWWSANRESHPIHSVDSHTTTTTIHSTRAAAETGGISGGGHHCLCLRSGGHWWRRQRHRGVNASPAVSDRFAGEVPHHLHPLIPEPSALPSTMSTTTNTNADVTAATQRRRRHVPPPPPPPPPRSMGREDWLPNANAQNVHAENARDAAEGVVLRPSSVLENLMRME